MTALGIILGIIPGFAWLYFYLQEDPHPEPKRLIALTFFSGISFGFYALLAENILNRSLRLGSFDTLGPLSIIIFAGVEELFKFFAAYYAVHKNTAFDEPVDAMIYMVVASLGFATLENLGALNFGGGSVIPISGAFEIASLRFVGATLLHTLTSAIIGYGWAISIRDFGKKSPLLWGIIAATILHAFFNYLIINLGAMAYSILFLLITGFFVLTDFEKLRERAV